MTERYLCSRVTAAALSAFALGFIGVAEARRDPVIMPPSFSISASRCGFQIDVGVLANNEYQEVETLADGTTITRITGKLKLSFTNHDHPDISIVQNVSGPTTETDYPDGSGTFVGEGRNWFAFGPISQGNTGEPGLVFTSGRVVFHFNSSHVVTDFSLDGNENDGCELLAD